MPKQKQQTYVVYNTPGTIPAINKTFKSKAEAVVYMTKFTNALIRTGK